MTNAIVKAVEEYKVSTVPIPADFNEYYRMLFEFDLLCSNAGFPTKKIKAIHYVGEQLWMDCGSIYNKEYLQSLISFAGGTITASTSDKPREWLYFKL